MWDCSSRPTLGDASNAKLIKLETQTIIGNKGTQTATLSFLDFRSF